MEVRLLNAHDIVDMFRSMDPNNHSSSLRYLKGFKWRTYIPLLSFAVSKEQPTDQDYPFPDNLTEQIATETAERQSRMRAEISKSSRENKEFVRNIQKAKELEGMQSKAAAKKSREAENSEDFTPTSTPTPAPGTATEAAADPDESNNKHVRKFKQASTGRKGPDKAAEAAKRVLSKLF